MRPSGILVLCGLTFVQFALLRYIDLGLPGLVGTVLIGTLAYAGARAVLVLCGVGLGTWLTLRAVAHGNGLMQQCACGAKLSLEPLPPLPFDLYAHVSAVAEADGWASFSGPVGEDAYCCPECAAKLRGTPGA